MGKAALRTCNHSVIPMSELKHSHTLISQHACLLYQAESKGEAPQYDGKWRDADPAEVKAKLDAGEPHTYRFKVPKGKVSHVQLLRPESQTYPYRDDQEFRPFIYVRLVNCSNRSVIKRTFDHDHFVNA